MSTDQVAKAKPQETVITYVPLGESNEISLTLARVKQFLCTPTRSGGMPTDAQVMKFMMMCKAQSLNPWLNDAFCVGYDTNDGPSFSLITSHQAMLKRAEASPEYDGMEAGVVVEKGGVITERPGDMILAGEQLVGAWARVHRRDRKIASYDALNFETFNTGRSRWKADPAGMIVKCAEASALRKAFPSTLAAMYCREEMDRHRYDEEATAQVDTRSKTERLAERVAASLPDRTAETQPIVTESQPAVEPEKVEAQRGQKKPAKEREIEPEQRKPSGGSDRANNLSRRIHLATSKNDLAHLLLEVSEAVADGGITAHEGEALTGLINEKMPK